MRVSLCIYKAMQLTLQHEQPPRTRKQFLVLYKSPSKPFTPQVKRHTAAQNLTAIPPRIPEHQSNRIITKHEQGPLTQEPSPRVKSPRALHLEAANEAAQRAALSQSRHTSASARAMFHTLERTELEATATDLITLPRVKYK